MSCEKYSLRISRIVLLKAWKRSINTWKAPLTMLFSAMISKSSSQPKPTNSAL
ncbi:hypothetical protein OESDEN_15119 [Oesophagostomum dentatum]|uniref:Uncharacterized protein n=1 Tax=Oesophagostomum dentatum TaxID=61180 RepID=A0A0B1SJT5_OESDE|nr:hypothetical protein OESDEN_15119 [Oesophagostomum dentatum]